ncbi:MAG: hypothetical protein IKB42_01540 [Clostridia bacterium]|nr:hypothetical protein [Clostridia bacterium]
MAPRNESLKREDFSYDELSFLSDEQLMEVATGILNSEKKENLPCYRTSNASSAWVTVNGLHYVCELNYAKQVINIKEMLDYSKMLKKYMDRTTELGNMPKADAVVSGVCNRKVQLASRLDVICKAYVNNVYAMGLDTPAFDKLTNYYINFMHNMTSVYSKTVPIFKTKKSKMVDVREITPEYRQTTQNYATDYVGVISKDKELNK